MRSSGQNRDHAGTVKAFGRKLKGARIDEMEAQRVRAPELFETRSTEGPVTGSA